MMSKARRAITAATFCLALGAGFAGNAIERPTFAEWNARVTAAPGNRQLRNRLPAPSRLPLRQFNELEAVIDDFFQLCRTGSLSRRQVWHGSPPPGPFYDPARAYFRDPGVPFVPFVQRLRLAPGTELIINGDLHGDVHSLMGRLRWLNAHKYLDGFRLVRTNAVLLFLGDYADRGFYGVEVFYTLLRLKLENPDRVFLGRGNHEDFSLATDYGLLAEGQGKYGAGFNLAKTSRFFDFLPVAIYVGCGTNYIQCSHGGLEPGFNPGPLLDSAAPSQYQLLGELRRRPFAQSSEFRKLAGAEMSTADAMLQNFTPASPTLPFPIGFLWTDFTLVAGEPAFRIDPGRGAVYGQGPARLILKAAHGTNSALRGVVRAHQHSSLPNPMMRRLVASRGMFRHWQKEDSLRDLAASVASLARRLETNALRVFPDGTVWTMNVSPNSVYGAGCGFDFDAFSILTLSEDFTDWRMRVVNP
jgi:hypothetical protein